MNWVPRGEGQTPGGGGGGAKKRLESIGDSMIRLPLEMYNNNTWTRRIMSLDAISVGNFHFCAKI